MFRAGEFRPGSTRPVSSLRNRRYGAVNSVTPAGLLIGAALGLDYDPGLEAALGGEGEVISLNTRASAEESEAAPGRQIAASAKATLPNVLAG